MNRQNFIAFCESNDLQLLLDDGPGRRYVVVLPSGGEQAFANLKEAAAWAENADLNSPSLPARPIEVVLPDASEPIQGMETALRAAHTQAMADTLQSFQRMWGGEVQRALEGAAKVATARARAAFDV